MMVDTGFWDENGNYIPDIQDVSLKEIINPDWVDIIEEFNRRLNEQLRKNKEYDN